MEANEEKSPIAGWITAFYLLTTLVNVFIHAVVGLGTVSAIGAFVASFFIFFAVASASGEFGRKPLAIAFGTAAIAAIIAALASWGYFATGVIMRFWMVEFSQLSWIATSVALGAIAGRAQHWGPIIQPAEGYRD